MTCAMAALVAAFAHYFTVGVFFSLQQILHNETFEVTIVANLDARPTFLDGCVSR